MHETQRVLPTSEQCLQYFREYRFGDGVVCPHCTGIDIARKGKTGKGARRYLCRDCSSYFNDLTDTVFAGHQLSVEEMFYIIVYMDHRSVADISREIGRTYKPVLQFVHKVDDHVDGDTIVTEIQDESEIEPFLTSSQPD